MSLMLNRRRFLHTAAIASGSVLLGAGGNWAVAAWEKDGWAFPLLGDLHFDRPAHHDHDWLARTHPGYVEQVRNYVRLARETLPPLFAAVRERIAGAKLPVPSLFTKGNHDVTGPGAAAVYDRKLVPFLAEQAGAEIASAAFTRERGRTLLVLYDAYDRGSLDCSSG
jgi:hypothetical protein